MPDLSFLQVAIPAVVAGIGALSVLARRHERLLSWERSAKSELRDNQVEISGFLAWWRKLTARSGENQVRITARGGKAVVVEIEGPEGFSEIEIRRPLFGSPRGEIEIGDESFDKQLILEGPPLTVAARLDEIMRRRLLSAISGCSSLEIGDGRLRAEVSDGELRRMLPVLLDIGRRLAEHVPVERRVAENARRDSFPGVRIFNMLLLARERPGDPIGLELLREACTDENPEVRLRAAIELGEEGRDVVLKIAERSMHDASAAQAVAWLGDTLPFETLRGILTRSLPSLSKKRGGLVRTVRACVEELGRRGAPAAGLLAQALAESKGEPAAAAARALGNIGAASAEPALLQALQSEDEGVWIAAATALGRVGTAAAVPVLQEAAGRSRLDRALRRAARQAVDEIQSRLVGAAPGQLSLAAGADDVGQLSLASGDAGGLSLASDGAGELAMLPHGAEGEEPASDGRPQRVRSGLS